MLKHTGTPCEVKSDEKTSGIICETKTCPCDCASTGVCGCKLDDCGQCLPCNYLFVSDVLPSAKLTGQFKNLVIFSKSKFTNRSPADLVTLGCSDLWVDVSNDAGRQWLERYLPAKATHRVIALYSNKRSKWIGDIEPFATTTCKKSILDGVEALSFEEMAKILKDGLLRIHKSPNFLANLLSCGSNIVKSKK
jgi:hypothetical protein